MLFPLLSCVQTTPESTAAAHARAHADLRAGTGGLKHDIVDALRPVSDVSHNTRGEYLGSWVADVTMVHRDGKVLRQALKRIAVLRELYQTRARVKKYSVDTINNCGPINVS